MNILISCNDENALEYLFVKTCDSELVLSPGCSMNVRSWLSYQFCTLSLVCVCILFQGASKCLLAVKSVLNSSATHMEFLKRLRQLLNPPSVCSYCLSVPSLLAHLLKVLLTCSLPSYVICDLYIEPFASSPFCHSASSGFLAVSVMHMLSP